MGSLIERCLLPCLVLSSTAVCMAKSSHPPDEQDHVPWLLIAPLERPAPKSDQASATQSTTPQPFVEITVVGDVRRIRGNGLPNHKTGSFPTRGNPNEIKAQNYNFTIPVEPKEQPKLTSAGMGMFGVALNGCFFEAGTAEYWKRDRNSGWRIEAIGPRGAILGLDFNNAHVQPTGAYHYHSVPVGLIEAIVGEESARKPILIGWAADGYPLYGPWGYTDPKDPESSIKRLTPSWRLKEGTRPSKPKGPGGRYDGTYQQDFHYVAESGDLDECNGRFGVTPEFPEGTYYYVVTETFPFISRNWKALPSSGMRKPGGGRGADHRRDGDTPRRGRGTGRGPGNPPPGRRPGTGPKPGPPPRT